MKDTDQAALARRRRTKAEAALPAGADERLARLAESRIAVEGVSIEIDGGRFPAKVVQRRPAVIEADIFADGHDSIDAAFL